ncbi:MAG: anti-sigma regulatory factor [Acidobacteria bacterium]|nr:anti-sigma regulatory factor [Acidobacteriota bacterium]
MKTATEVQVSIRSDTDIVIARQQARSFAAQLGFSGTDLTIIATAVSEMARNIVIYAGNGEITIEAAQDGAQKGICVIARDRGPGISDVARAMEDGYSTVGSLGLGLPGTKRLVDEFHVVSKVGEGTTVTIKKWRR